MDNIIFKVYFNSKCNSYFVELLSMSVVLCEDESTAILPRLSVTVKSLKWIMWEGDSVALHMGCMHAHYHLVVLLMTSI